jgi:phage baseplate assembly protein W
MAVDHPFHFDGRGHTAQTGDDDHLRDLIEQVLFTSPGERVNRPTFGSGLLRLVFDPASETIAAATQFAVQAALQQWLGDLIEPRQVAVEIVDATVRVTVQYVVRSTQEPRVAAFTRSVP